MAFRHELRAACSRRARSEDDAAPVGVARKIFPGGHLMGPRLSFLLCLGLPRCRPTHISSARFTDSRLRRGLPVTPRAMAEPQVSVVVTTFNQGPDIAEAIRSVLSQTNTNREIIVVDDGSTDDTPRVLAGFGNAITTIRQANEGVAGARNCGIRAARGLLLAFIDGDDRWHPDTLRRLVEAHERFPATGLIACDARSFDGFSPDYSHRPAARERGGIRRW